MDSHRPWPAPSAPHALEMRWRELLFAHWPVALAELRALVPPAFELDTFEGRGWLGVVPFRMADTRFRGLPSLGFGEDFLELNLRTYVRVGGRPGVWFFSLDAQSALAVAGARALFHLPYFTARMRATVRGAALEYESERSQSGAPAARVRVSYAPSGPLFRAKSGTLEHFLTERYCLYALDSGGRVLCGEIDHEPWPLQLARADFGEQTLSTAAGFGPLRGAPLTHYARELAVRAWAPSVVNVERA